ncbi:MAG: hypothetical protein JWM00_506 [Candidatus Saccharibacteria bacterium]|nr:hypothetical protein [Candidatus Saccharibacteria bacterium]
MDEHAPQVERKNDSKDVLNEALRDVIDAGKRAIEAGEGTRFGLELRSLADDVLHRDDREHGIERSGVNVFEENKEGK